MKLKKILILIAIPVVIIATLPFVLSSCNKTKPESDWMLSLYQDHDKNRGNAALSSLSDYTSKWTTLANSNHKVNGHKEIQYAIEYSLFSFIYKSDYYIMDNLFLSSSLFSLLDNNGNGMYVTFQTTYCDVNPDSLLVAYVGSMTLNFTKNIVLNDSGFALGKDDVIQCVYSFSDVTLSSETTTTDNWYKDIYTFSPSQVGNSMGFIQIVHNSVPYGNLQQVSPVVTDSKNPNYFNTKA